VTKFETLEIPANMLEEAKAKRAEMIEKLADIDDSIMELFMEEKEPSREQIIAAIRKGTVNFSVVPVIMGSAFKNKGVQQMLDAVVRYLPSPLEVGAIKGFKQGDPSVEIDRAPSEDEPFSALAFKIMSDPHLGKLTYIRIYSGKLEPGTSVLNATKDRRERIGKIYQMHANKREERESATAGLIVAVMGLKDTTTGDTLVIKINQLFLNQWTFRIQLFT
jgi:elongation factor G